MLVFFTSLRVGDLVDLQSESVHEIELMILELYYQGYKKLRIRLTAMLWNRTWVIPYRLTFAFSLWKSIRCRPNYIIINLLTRLIHERARVCEGVLN